jgi:hypothetical protein
MNPQTVRSYSVVVGNWFVELALDTTLGRPSFDVISAASLNSNAKVSELDDERIEAAIVEQRGVIP